MIRQSTHFDQVPLEVVKKLIEEKIVIEETVTSSDETKRISYTKIPVASAAVNEKGRKS
jgi:hypothetical protein